MPVQDRLSTCFVGVREPRWCLINKGSSDVRQVQMSYTLVAHVMSHDYQAVLVLMTLSYSGEDLVNCSMVVAQFCFWGFICSHIITFIVIIYVMIWIGNNYIVNIIQNM